MRVPFPLALNIGTDIIAINRIIKPHLTSTSSTITHLQRLSARFLHPQELSDLNTRFPSWQTPPSSSDIEPQHLLKVGTYLAGRWAAKEAAKKAWGATLISFKDLRTEVSSTGEVGIVCRSYRHGSDGGGGDGGGDGTSPGWESNGSMEQVAKLSISHDGGYAVATVIATPLHPEIVAELEVRREAARLKVAGGASSVVEGRGD